MSSSLDLELADTVPSEAVRVTAAVLAAPVEVVAVSTVEEIARLEAAAREVKVTDKNSADAAGILFKQAQAALKQIEAARVTVKQPFLELTRAIDAAAKGPMERLSAVKTGLERGIGAWVKEEEDRRRREWEAAEKARREAEEKARKEREAIEAEQRRKEEEARKRDDFLDVDLPAEAPVTAPKPAVAAPVVPAAPARVAPTGVQVRRVLVFSVVDLAKVPEELLKPREVALVRVNDKYCRGWTAGQPLPVVPGLVFREEVATR